MFDMESGRCMECDGRYCTMGCERTETTVWVVGVGWREPDVAATTPALDPQAVIAARGF
jgi:hypothetical protein